MLESSPGVHECPHCGGLFVSKDALADILCRAEVGGPMRDAFGGRDPVALEQVRYVPCPLCHATMNRLNFARISGVIVDVCRSHGTWFDAGELTRVIAFAASGGLEKARAREREQHAAAERAARARHVEIPMVTSTYEMRTASLDRLEMWRDVLRVLFDD